MAQMIKHLPTMWEAWVQPLGREDLLEKEMATHSIYKIMSSVNSNSFTFCFSPFVLTGTSSGDSGIPVFPDLTGIAFRFSPLSVMLAVGLSYTAFSMLIYFMCTLRVFVINRCWILSNAFSAPTEMLIRFLSFTLHFVNVVLCVDDLWMLNHPCIL